MSDQRERLARGEWYLLDDDLAASLRQCWRTLDRYNATTADQDAERRRILEELLGAAGPDALVLPPFRCSYGSHVRLGSRAFVNHNCLFMDDAPITIGDDVRIGPGSQLLTAIHPMEDHDRRRDGWERALPITIGANAWLGAGVLVCPGVTIGADAVVGAGSVVLRDVPDRTFVAGKPARVIREL
ncbi:sugar O-acetyltransferase [Pseudonocardia sp. CA-107938]|uniref:sugar O-acetyltransferase n=1 Tax=Pseudonocardia sp. CA-107938 TaxID=3240021 RepID=UPI003D8C28BC